MNRAAKHNWRYFLNNSGESGSLAAFFLGLKPQAKRAKPAAQATEVATTDRVFSRQIHWWVKSPVYRALLRSPAYLRSLGELHAVRAQRRVLASRARGDKVIHRLTPPRLNRLHHARAGIKSPRYAATPDESGCKAQLAVFSQ